MNRFPKRRLRRLRKQAIKAADAVATCENSWGARNIEKQYATIDALRRTVQEAQKSIGLERVTFILNHNVPQIRSLLDLTSPRRGERGDLLPKQYVEAILANTDSEIERIATSRWRLLGIPGVVVAVVGLMGILAKSGQLLGPTHLRNTESPSPSPAYTPRTVAAPAPIPNSILTETPMSTPKPITPASTAASMTTPLPSTRTASMVPSSSPEISKPIPLGDLVFSHIKVSRAGEGSVRVDAQLTNGGAHGFYVFAGTPLKGISYDPRPQTLTGTASDNLDNGYTLDSVQGFTQAKDFYFDGLNQFTELSAGESAVATFTFKITSPYVRNTWEPKRPSRLNLNIEFALVLDPGVKESHRTKALSLTSQTIE